MPSYEYTEKQKTDIFELYNLGVSYSRIARALNVDYTKLGNFCKQMIAEGKLPERDRIHARTRKEEAELQEVLNRKMYGEIPFQDDVDAGKILALRRAGWKIKDIAGDMELNERQVAQIVEEAENNE